MKYEFTPYEINFIEQFDKNFRICMFEIFKKLNEGISSIQKRVSNNLSKRQAEEERGGLKRWNTGHF